MTTSQHTITTPDGSFSAYVARPDNGGQPAPAVVVIQEIFGVNHVMRDIADDLAAKGFVAIVPDLFWRIEPGIQLTDRSEAEWKRAFELFNAFDVDKGVADIAATITQIRHDPGVNGKVGCVGYCLGGLLAYLTATRTDVDASIGYYGVGLDKHLAEAVNLKHPLLLHIAELDGFCPPAARDQIIAGLSGTPNVELVVYPGRDHAFARVGGEHFHADDAERANAASLALFRKALV
jgi:carboxymethylenebutenolidase